MVTFRFPRSVNRFNPKVEQIFPNTGSAVPSLLLLASYFSPFGFNDKCLDIRIEQ